MNILHRSFRHSIASLLTAGSVVFSTGITTAAPIETAASQYEAECAEWANAFSAESNTLGIDPLSGDAATALVSSIEGLVASCAAATERSGFQGLQCNDIAWRNFLANGDRGQSFDIFQSCVSQS
jgi:hypothetical protein